MKKLALGFMTAFLLLFVNPQQSKADTDQKTVSTTVSTTASSAEANAMVVRLNEIKAMDMTTLSSSEKKDLRKEVRGIKKELNKGESTSAQGNNGGVYLSVGAIIIIVLLLILLL